MKKRPISFTALLLFLVTVLSLAAGCDLQPDDIDSRPPAFDAPYIDNYYVNKHVPECRSGSITVCKYESASSPIVTIGGNDYRGGFIIESGWGYDDLGCIELPLDGLYKSISFVIGGHYSLRRMSVGEDGTEVYASGHPYIGSYPTIGASGTEASAGIQFLIDGEIAEEIILSEYDTERRYTFDISDASTFTFKLMANSGIKGIPVMELTVWDGEAKATGHSPQAAPNTAVKLIRDLKPYLIPTSSSSVYYPSYTEGERTITIANTEYTDVLLTQVSSDILGTDDGDREDIFFNLEGSYSFLSFSAGAADGSNSGSARLTVYADGKKLLEDTITYGELQKKYTLSVEGCKQLRFSWARERSSNGGFAIADAYLAASMEVLSSLELSEERFPRGPVRMISELGILSLQSEPEHAVFYGNNGHKSFKMAGRAFQEGVILLSTSSLLLGNEPAQVSFNLGGRYDKVNFIAGYINGRSVYKDEKLRIYADGVEIKEIDISCTSLPTEYSIDTAGCHLLEFILSSEHATSPYRPAIGIANLVAYAAGDDIDGLFSSGGLSVCPDHADLIELFGFYEVRNPTSDIRIGGVSSMDGYFNGSGRSSFKLGGKYYSRGLILHSSTDASPDVVSLAGSGLMSAPIARQGLSAATLSSEGVAQESAFAVTNISGGGYTSLSFTAACLKRKASVDAADKATLRVFADGECIAELTVTENMKPTQCTLDIGARERLVFLLSSEAGSSSHYYALYDITLTK